LHLHLQHVSLEESEDNEEGSDPDDEEPLWLEPSEDKTTVLEEPWLPSPPWPLLYEIEVVSDIET
jgi:hypothetical protein